VFYTSEEVLTAARFLLNDAQGSAAGQLLADNTPYTWGLLNLCYDNLQDDLEDSNVESAMYAEDVITIPVSNSQDPAAQCRLGYDGFVDSNGFFYEAPTLPEYLIEPLQITQRISGQNAPFVPVKQRLGGLGTGYGPYLYEWEFRQNSVYFTGAAAVGLDLKVRYIPSLPALAQPTAENPAYPTIWFARCGGLLSYNVAAEFAEIRGAANAPNLRAKYNAKLQVIANKTSKRENQTQTRRRGYGFGRRRRVTDIGYSVPGNG
jgi:hypothetical protein